ncbi:hypothetical protein SO802_008698 [Lithocarpus litseifolius]|uniref:Uncharacterized protein n=1 Tax=Lithocarpus litseifolius TaxID=425828 RepID=A0AAW2DA17_9ROSI
MAPTKAKKKPAAKAPTKAEEKISKEGGSDLKKKKKVKKSIETYKIYLFKIKLQTKTHFKFLIQKPLTNANNDASGSKQEDNDDAIPSMSSASNVEDAEPNDDNMFLQDLINHRKATNQKSSKKKKLQRRK